MSFIDEQTVWASAVGLSLDSGRLASIAICAGTGCGNYADCSEYLIEDIDTWNTVLKNKLRITPAMIQKWAAKSISFHLVLYTNEGKLIGGHIYKFRHTSGSTVSPCGYLISPTQQEIRMTSRILEYLIAEVPNR